MSDNCETLPWDYFLTNYERDLLQLTIEEAKAKYLLVPGVQVKDDWLELRAILQIDHEH